MVQKWRKYDMDLIRKQIDIRNELPGEFGKHEFIPMIESIREKSMIQKTNKYFRNYAIEAGYLLGGDIELFSELIVLSKGKKKNTRLFIYGKGLVELVTTMEFRALQQVFTVIPLWPTLPVPNPPGPVPPGPKPIPDPSDYNLIPSDIEGKCRPTLIVRPDLPCQNENYGGEEDNLIESIVERRNRAAFEHIRPVLYWLPLQYWDEPHNPVSKRVIIDAFNLEGCFEERLNEAALHAEQCLYKHDGEMNFNIIVQIKQETVDSGFLKHSSYKRFKRRIANLNEEWKRVFGVSLTEQIV